jgi:vancomycin permeability regulator SanA
MLADRLDFGVKLYKNDKAPKILVSGDHGTKGYDEVNAMREYLLKKGVPSADIFMDHAGFDTYDSAYRARDVFLIKKAIFVSQDFHIVRAVYIGRQLGLQVYGVASDPREYAGIEYNKLREVLSRIKAVLDTEILKSKPKFLGEPIPVWGNGEVTIDK